jgi:hypothetical protein
MMGSGSVQGLITKAPAQDRLALADPALAQASRVFGPRRFFLMNASIFSMDSNLAILSALSHQPFLLLTTCPTARLRFNKSMA